MLIAVGACQFVKSLNDKENYLRIIVILVHFNLVSWESKLQKMEP